MAMQPISALLVTVVLFPAPVVAGEGTVGEDFEAAGTAFGVSGSYYNNLEGYSSFSIRPSF